MSDRLEGTRVYDKSPHLFVVGEYGRWGENGDVYACCPGGLGANLAGHEITEHADGRITASPSILVRDGVKEWHGYLENGVFRSC